MHSMKRGERACTMSGDEPETPSPSEKPSMHYINEEKIERSTRPQHHVESSSKLESSISKAPWEIGVTRAAKLNSMTLEDRINGLYDLHCVSTNIVESPEYVDAKLEELDGLLKKSLRSIMRDPKIQETFLDSQFTLTNEILHPAAEMEEEYYSSNEMKLQFLRAERFETAKATIRMERYFQAKHELFGSASKMRRLCPDDLSEDDWVHARTGYIQVLTERDQKGRAIIFIMGRLSMQTPVETSLRILFFLCNSIAEKDEELQKSGVVMVYYAIGQEFFSREHATKCLELCSALPLRIEAAHACYDDPALETFFDTVSHQMTSECLVRFRPHFGTSEECQSALLSFGIPINKSSFPLRSDGTLNLVHLRRWFESIGIEERALSPDREETFLATDGTASTESTTPTMATTEESTDHLILHPAPFDVIMGRGRRGQRSAGNQHYRHLLVTYRSKYESANNFEKTLVAELVLKIMKERGCRFLKKNSDAPGWVEVTDDVAREKISHAFRNLRGT